MSETSPARFIAANVVRIAAAQPTWRKAFDLLCLEPTDENVAAFALRAAELNVDVSHLRWRQDWSSITTDELRAAAVSARTYLEVLGNLGFKPGGSTYDKLEAVCAERGVTLPARRSRAFGVVHAEAHFACSDEAVRAAFAEAQSMADLLRRVGLVPKGANYAVMRRRLRRIGLDPNLLRGQGWSSGKALNRRPLTELLQRGQVVSGPYLMRRLLAEGLFERRCAMCGLEEWLGRPIPLELDHINGVHDDNRLENLRLLCPTCHALTPTYRGRNVPLRRQIRLLEAPEC
jgi:hypothetical protein